MNQSHQDESVANGALARRIKQVMHGRQTQAEHTRILSGKNNAGKAPDIVITATGRSPVIIEAEYSPAINVEQEARDRLGCRIRQQTHPVEAVIALRYPKGLAGDDVDAVLADTRELTYCAVYPKGKRFPTTGWLTGSVIDLADLIHLVDVPETAFDKAAKDLENSIDEAVSGLGKENDYPLTDKIFNALQLSEDPTAKNLPKDKRLERKNEQTRRIAGAMIANALIFQERIAPAYPEHNIPLVNDIRRHGDRKQRALTAWQKILEINYWPIFDAAIQIIDVLTAFPAGEVLRILAKAAESVQEKGLLYENDLTGHVFQKLIIDRKYLAAFYTMPESAALLAKLAVAKMKDVDWSDADKIGALKIADFACGTGALLSAVYDQIANRYERHGDKRNPKDLHKPLMEKVLMGFDVLPFATHLTASVLSGKHPDVIYDRSRIYTMPFGRQKDKEVKIGSLEFLGSAEQPVLVHTGDPDKQTGGQGDDLLRVDVWNSLDLVIMNPPFTRNVTREGKYEGTFAAAFAGFGASDADQRKMAEEMKKLKRGTCYHGNAGMASAFVAIANKKLKPGGVLALVLPLTAAAGEAWQNMRALLAKHYEDIEVISLADAKCYNVAFSADTSMADCLVIARKKSAYIPKSVDIPTRFVSLHQRPQYLAAAGETARKLNELSVKKIKRKLESGPFGADVVFCGKEKMGETIQANIQREKPKWNLIRIQDFELVQTAYQLTQGKLHLPRCEVRKMEITQLKFVGKRGLLSLDLTGPAPYDDPVKKTHSSLPRGPFDLIDSTPKPTDTYPTLWNHDCSKEHKLICKPDKN